MVLMTKCSRTKVEINDLRIDEDRWSAETNYLNRSFRLRRMASSTIKMNKITMQERRLRDNVWTWQRGYWGAKDAIIARREFRWPWDEWAVVITEPWRRTSRWSSADASMLEMLALWKWLGVTVAERLVGGDGVGDSGAAAAKSDGDRRQMCESGG